MYNDNLKKKMDYILLKMLGVRRWKMVRKKNFFLLFWYNDIHSIE